MCGRRETPGSREPDRSSLAIRQLRERPFHGLTAVAPLKPSTARRKPMIRDSFPRPHRRGPIEACSVPAKVVPRCGFPRPHRRGPIEARLGNARKATGVSFHGLTAVAPLKQRAWPLGRLLGAFPRPHRRGPIEAPTNPPRWPQQLLPRPHRRGPIEARIQRRDVRGSIVLSTASPPWPH